MEKLKTLLLVVFVFCLGMMFSIMLTRPQPKCWEDDPCWDCSTMGNLVCGK